MSGSGRFCQYLRSQKGRFSETDGQFGLIAYVTPDRLSRNLFPNEFSRNCPLDMEKRDAPQTRVYVTIAGPVRSWAIHVTQPVTRSMRRKGCLAYDSEHPLTGPHCSEHIRTIISGCLA